MLIMDGPIWGFDAMVCSIHEDDKLYLSTLLNAQIVPANL